MLTITNQSDYGILLIERLISKKGYVPLSDLVKETKLPKRFLARISATLVKHKIIESREGKTGGYKLLADLNKVSLYDYLKIFEKNVIFCKCSEPDFDCRYDNLCHHRSYLKNKLEKIVVDQLKKTKLKELFNLC